MTTIQEIKSSENGIRYYEIKSQFVRLIVTNLGCHILSIFTRDKEGNEGDVVLSFRDVETDLNDGTYMGAVVGRIANRIRNGSFDLNGETYTLAVNNGPNHLHGGIDGFNKKVFVPTMIEDGISFRCISNDMEEGYPGTMTLDVDYVLKDNKFSIHYHAVTDKDTICNLTNHTYFNLSAGKSKIYDHQVMMKADRIACVDSDCCPTGEYLPVEGTPFDFNEFHKIGERIGQDHEQLIFGSGYDHPFIFSQPEDQVVVWDEESGRRLQISTDLPGAQLYTGNFLEGSQGKYGKIYENRDGLAVETQFLPDSIHIEENSPTILRAGSSFESTTTYTFDLV